MYISARTCLCTCTYTTTSGNVKTETDLGPRFTAKSVSANTEYIAACFLLGSPLPLADFCCIVPHFLGDNGSLCHYTSYRNNVSDADGVTNRLSTGEKDRGVSNSLQQKCICKKIEQKRPFSLFWKLLKIWPNLALDQVVIIKKTIQ